MKPHPSYEDLLTENAKLKKENVQLKKSIERIAVPEDYSLQDLIDINQLQDLMNNFYELTGLGIGIIDNQNKILVSTGWQDICTKYHRTHPMTCKKCKESDSIIFKKANVHAPVEYKCQNGMWDIGYPITIKGETLAVIFFGQFFYDDEEIDEEFFSDQAQKYGFDKKEYISELQKVPVISREKVQTLISFYSKLAQYIAELGYQQLLIKRLLQKERNEARQKIAEQKEFLDNIIENLPVGLQIFDKKGTSFRINRKQKELLGLPNLDEGIGKFNVLTDPYSKANGSDKRYATVYNKRKIISHDFEFDFNIPENQWKTRKDKRIFRETIYPVLDKSNQVSHVIALLQDITESTRANEKINEQNSSLQELNEELTSLNNDLATRTEEYKALFVSAGDAAFVMSRNRFIDCNERTEALFRLSKEKLINLHPWELSPPLQKNGQASKELAEAKMNAVLKGEIQHFEWTHKKADGELFDVEVTLNLVDKKKELFYAVLRDITQRVKAEEEVERNKALLSQNEGLSKVGAWEYTVATNEMYWTDGLYRLHGMDPEDNIDHISESLKCYHEADRLKIKDAFENCIKKGLPYDLVFPFTTVKGENRWIRTKTQPISENGKVVRVLGSVADITEHKHIENKLIELNATKDKFFSIIAHDLRSPYSALLGFTEMIGDRIREEDYDELKNLSGIISKSVNNSFELLNNLLQWARVQTGGIEFKPEIQKLNDIIAKTLDSLEANIIGKELEVNVEVDSNIEVVADKFMLESILLNLISNAIKYSFRTGKIIITATTKDQITTISIRDFGVGIKAKNIDKIFRIDNNYTTPGTSNEKGTGLGLILTREFVEKHGGTIHVSSKEGTGANFVFTLNDKVRDN